MPVSAVGARSLQICNVLIGNYFQLILGGTKPFKSGIRGCCATSHFPEQVWFDSTHSYFLFIIDTICSFIRVQSKTTISCAFDEDYSLIATLSRRTEIGLAALAQYP